MKSNRLYRAFLCKSLKLFTAVIIIVTHRQCMAYNIKLFTGVIITVTHRQWIVKDSTGPSYGLHY